MGTAYSPVNEKKYKMLNKQKKPRPIKVVTGGSSRSNDIYLIPYISEKRYQDGYSKRNKIEWTFDFGEINSGDIFILDSRWDSSQIAVFATCLWNSPNYVGKPLLDNGWSKGKFNPKSSDFYTHKNSIEIGYFHNQSFSTLPRQFYCADFSKINLNQFTKGSGSNSAYTMSTKKFLKKYKGIICKDPLGECCQAKNKRTTILAPKKYNKKSADRITGFNPSGDKIRIDTESFEINKSASFKTAKNRKAVKKLAKKDIDFLYDQKKGGLYFNENGSKKGFGDGGLIAILKGGPDLTSKNVSFI